MRTANPALNANVFRATAMSGDSTEVMTLDGTVNKSAFGIALTMGAAWWSWTQGPSMAAFLLPSLIGTLLISIVLFFKKSWAPGLTPLYAVAEGVLLGTISLFAETKYPGIVFQAVSLTFGTFAALLMAYKSKMIPVTENFKLGLVAATGGICVVYLLSFILSFFNVSMSFLHDSSLLSIGISFFVVIVAALNLVLDFDFIENGARAGNLPKYMEWYAAFGLLVTLVWLYLEILRLLMKLADRK